MLELALVLHGDLRSGLDAPLAGVARGVDQPGEAGRDEMSVLGGLQHVERLFVGERGVIDVLDAVADALLDRARRARMRRRATLLRRLRLAHRHRHLFLRHRRFFGAHAGDLFAREIELDRVDAVFDQRAHRAAHFLRAGDDDAEIEPFVRNVRRRGVAEAADGGDLRPRRQIARAGDHAAVDGVAHDDVEARLGRRRAAPCGEAGVEHELWPSAR